MSRLVEFLAVVKISLLSLLFADYFIYYLSFAADTAIIVAAAH